MYIRAKGRVELFERAIREATPFSGQSEILIYLEDHPGEGLYLFADSNKTALNSFDPKTIEANLNSLNEAQTKAARS